MPFDLCPLVPTPFARAAPLLLVLLLPFSFEAFLFLKFDPLPSFSDRPLLVSASFLVVSFDESLLRDDDRFTALSLVFSFETSLLGPPGLASRFLLRDSLLLDVCLTETHSLEDLLREVSFFAFDASLTPFCVVRFSIEAFFKTLVLLPASDEARREELLLTVGRAGSLPMARLSFNPKETDLRDWLSDSAEDSRSFLLGDMDRSLDRSMDSFDPGEGLRELRETFSPRKLSHALVGARKPPLTFDSVGLKDALLCS